MIEILSSAYFKYLVVLLLTTFFVIFIKSVSRNDRHNTFFKKEDFAFGLEMGITAILLLLGNSVTIAQQTISDPNSMSIVNEKLSIVGWIALMLTFGLWGVSTIVRRLGWQSDTELKIFWGIIFPDVFGLIVLISDFQYYRKLKSDSFVYQFHSSHRESSIGLI
jgi:hypothetical protein